MEGFIAKKPFLNARHVKSRMSWCKPYLKMDPNSWQNFIFTDESRIELYSRRRKYVRRPTGKRFNVSYTLKTVKYGGPHILVWGPLKQTDQKSCVYVHQHWIPRNIRVLDTALIPFLSNDSVVMQYGETCHRSGSTLDYPDSRSNCLVSDWPSLSPVKIFL